MPIVIGEGADQGLNGTDVQDLPERLANPVADTPVGTLEAGDEAFYGRDPDPRERPNGRSADVRVPILERVDEWLDRSDVAEMAERVGRADANSFVRVVECGDQRLDYRGIDRLRESRRSCAGPWPRPCALPRPDR